MALPVPLHRKKRHGDAADRLGQANPDDVDQLARLWRGRLDRSHETLGPHVGRNRAPAALSEERKSHQPSVGRVAAWTWGRDLGEVGNRSPSPIDSGLWRCNFPAAW